MESEKIFNLFLICKDELITKIGYKTHIASGTDEEKSQFLKANMEADIKDLTYIPLPDRFKVRKEGKSFGGISITNYNNLVCNNEHMVLFQEIFMKENSTNDPLLLITPLENGKIKFDVTVGMFPKKEKIEHNGLFEEIPGDYFELYYTPNGFDLLGLINDDFLKAPKLLFRNGLYVSCVKLLLSALDSISFLEYGDENKIFIKWLDEYCELKKVNITAEELWEFRNSLLHMTNNKSRKVIKGKVSPLSFYVTDIETYVPTAGESLKYFNLKILIDVFSKGIENWANTFNEDRNKIHLFIKRYDLIISDKRFYKTTFRG